MSEGFDRWNGDGDWRATPWFLRENSLLDKWGYPLSLRQRAAEGLSSIYTPEVCRSIRDEDVVTAFGPIISLFVAPWPGLVVPLLDLGLNLHVVGGISPGDWLAKRLTRRAEFASAQFEMQVWANLKRARYGVERIPEGSTPTPDFRVDLGATSYDIEVKLAHQSDADEADEDLSDRLRHALPHLPGLHLRLRGSAELARRALDFEKREDLRDEFDVIVTAFARAAEAIKIAGLRPGAYEASPFGLISAEPEAGHGSISAEVLPDLPARKKAARVARLVRRNALPQLRGERPGLTVIGVFRAADLGLIQEALMDDRARPIDHRRCRGVILVDHARPPGAEPEDGVQIAYPFSTSRLSDLDVAELELASVVGGDVHRKARLARRAAPGDRAFYLDTSRRTVTSKSMGSVSYEPNSTTTFKFDGTPPTIVKRGPDEPSDE